MNVLSLLYSCTKIQSWHSKTNLLKEFKVSDILRKAKLQHLVYRRWVKKNGTGSDDSGGCVLKSFKTQFTSHNTFHQTSKFVREVLVTPYFKCWILNGRGIRFVWEKRNFICDHVETGKLTFRNRIVFAFMTLDKETSHGNIKDVEL